MTKSSIVVNGKEKKDESISAYLIQRPNPSFLRFPFKLQIYNLHNSNYKEKWQKKLMKFKDSSHLFTKIFSLKQAVVYTNFRKQLNEYVKEAGEIPVLYSEKKTKKTLKKLRLHYRSEGFFNAKLNYKVDSISSNKATVAYYIETGLPTFIDTISTRIASPVIDSIYKRHKTGSLIVKGDRYKRANFEIEASRLTSLFRNSGVYHFSKSAISFFEIDTANTNQKTNVLLNISNRFLETKDSLISVPFHVYTIKQVRVVTDYTYAKKDFILQDSIHYNGIDFMAFDRVKYKPKHLSKAIFISPGQKFSDINTELTRKHLRELNNYISIKIIYEEVANNQLIANILLSPSDRFKFKVETEATHENIKPFGISGKTSILNKNTLHGNEILQLGMQGSFFNSIELAGEDNSFLGFNAWEWGLDASYKVPRMLVPFNNKKHKNNKASPFTTFTLGYSTQKNIGLDKQRFSAIVKYNWKASKRIQHTIEALNAQYIRNLNVGSFFDIYKSEGIKLDRIQATYFPDLSVNNKLDFIHVALQDAEFSESPESAEDYRSVQNVYKRYKIITEDILVPALSYQFVYNTQTSYTNTNFNFFKAALSSSGLLATFFASESVEDGTKQLNGTNIAQYVKLDLEYKKNWDLKYHNSLAFRSSIGIAVPYGNSTSMPFSRSYFIGGPNDLRAWKIYELGPGKEKTGLEFNVGNFKMLNSLEYRFDVLGSLKAAFFVDAGNIWDVSDSDLNDVDAKFTGLASLKNTAVGSGFGLRYDLSFLILRGDLGFKTYEPYIEEGSKWFQDLKPVLNIGINYPF